MANINAYGMGGSPLINIFPPPIVANREPTTSDKLEIGQTWIYPAEDNCWVLTSMFNGNAIWTLQTQTGGGSGVFTNLTASGTINLDNTRTNVSSTYAVHAAGQNINITSDFGKISIVGGEGVADAVNITAGDPNGGIDIDSLLGGVTIDTTGNIAIATAGAGTIGIVSSATTTIASTGNLTLGSDANAILTSTNAAVDAVQINATDANGGIDIDSLLGGITVDTTGNIAIATAGAGTINMVSNTTSLIGAVGQLTLGSDATALLTSTAATADSIKLEATDAAGGIDISAGTGGMSIDIDGSILITAADNAVDAINIQATHADGGIDIQSGTGGIAFTAVAGSIELTASEGDPDAIKLDATHANGGIDIDSLLGGITVDTTGAFSIDGAAASNVSVSGAAVNLSLSSADGRVLIVGGQNLATAVTISSQHVNGGITAVSGTNGTTALSLGGVIQLTSNLAASNAVLLNSSAATGGVTVTSGAVAATTGLQLNQGAVTLAVQVGAGAPGHNAAQGSLYLRSDGTGVNDRLYINTNGAAAWTAIVTVA